MEGERRTNVGMRSRGPMGLGDPDDMSLRKIEKDIIIKKMVRAVARQKCSDEIKSFGDCASSNGIRMTLACRDENSKQIACLEKWFTDEELNEQMTHEYLKSRNNYRRTGAKAQPDSKT